MAQRCEVGIDIGAWYAVVDCVHNPNRDVPGNIDVST